MPFDQLPTMNELVGPAIDGLVSETSEPRRTALIRLANSGRYGSVINGWKAQGELVRRRLLLEIKASRLGFSKQDALKQLALSEFLVSEIPSTSTKAAGEVVLRRTLKLDSPNNTYSFTRGEIKKGTRFRRQADPNFVVPYVEAIYESTAPVVLGNLDTEPPTATDDGKWLHAQTVRVPIAASREGDHANAPTVLYATPPVPIITDRLFDSSFVGVSLSAAGGSTGMTDDDIEALARSTVAGTQGPNNPAGVAGALYYPGVRHVAAGLNAQAGKLSVFVADSSWASSTQLSAATLQYLSDFPWLGFGCRAESLPVNIYPIVAVPQIVLRARQYLDDTTEIADNVRKAVVAYFNDRPDWWAWRQDTAAAAVIAADSRILDCPDFGVLNPIINQFIAPPTDVPGRAQSLNHWHVVSDGVDMTFEGPS